jgi:ketosteroid isomerase-like protein
MRTFSKDAAAAAVELEQLAMDYWRDIDFNDARNLHDFYTEDCTFAAGENTYRGRNGIKAFYEIARVAKVGMTTRHSMTNLHVAVHDGNRATLEFIIMSYRGAGKLPITGLQGPALVSDGRMECRREADGKWRITAFSGAPVFMGNDPVLEKMAKAQAR